MYHFIEQVKLASSPTHKSDVAVAGATVIAYAVSLAIEGLAGKLFVISYPQWQTWLSLTVLPHLVRQWLQESSWL